MLTSRRRPVVATPPPQAFANKVTVVVNARGEFVTLYARNSRELMDYLDSTLGKGGWHTLTVTPQPLPSSVGGR